MYGMIYRMNQQRVAELVRDNDPEVVVPACPAWSATDVVRHVTGLAADVASGHVEGYATDEWTDHQVSSRAGMSLDQVIAEWDSVVDGVCAVLDDIGDSSLPEMINTKIGPQKRTTFSAAIVGDLHHHEFDLRNAFGDRTDRERPDVVGAGVGHAKALRPAFKAYGLPTLAVVIDGNPIPVGMDAPVASVSLSAFEAFRAIGGRRTLDEIRGYAWDGDSEQFVDRFVLPFFSPPGESLSEA